MGEAKRKQEAAPAADYSPGVVKTKAGGFYWIDAGGRVFRMLRGSRVREPAVIADVQAVAKMPPTEPPRVQLVER